MLALGLHHAGTTAWAQAPRGEGIPRLHTGRITHPLRLDGRLDEPEWAQADSIAGLTQVTPVEGGRPLSRTVVRVLADTRSLVFGIDARGADGVPITSFTRARDVEPDDEDYVGIVLDTFRDGRSGYVFAVNPGGARFDGLVIRQGESTDASWDGIWEAATHREGNHWSAEIRIPIRTLIFRPGLAGWGFNVQRQVKADQELTRWASPRQNIKVTQTSRSGILDGFPDFRLGVGTSVRPSAIAGGGHAAADSGFDGTAHASLDLTQRIGGNLLGSATLNTDFAETDADTRQTNLTRFPLYFPEKRTFFLEGKDIFEYGPNLGTDVVPFFSRRIGLLDGRETPLRVGARVTGRAGGTDLGALVSRTGAVEGLAPGATLAALRLRRSVLEESSVGAIATVGDPRGRRDAWTAGFDAIYHTSHFRGENNLTVGAWALGNGRDSLAGDRAAYGVLVDFPNDVWDISTSAKHLGDGFDPSLGFVPRQGANLFRLGLSYQPRPHRWGVRQMFFEQEYSLVTDRTGRWESYQIFLAPVNWRLESGDRFEGNVIPQGERLVEPFEVADGVTIAPGAYRFTRYRLELELAARRVVSGQLTWRFGNFYDGHLHQFQVEGGWKPLRALILEAEGEHDIGSLAGGSFKATVVGVRVVGNFSPDLTLASFVQYDSESRSLGTNTRLRWTFDPLGDFYLVYNHNLLDTSGGWRRESNQILAKLQYTLRY